MSPRGFVQNQKENIPTLKIKKKEGTLEWQSAIFCNPI